MDDDDDYDDVIIIMVVVLVGGGSAKRGHQDRGKANKKRSWLSSPPASNSEGQINKNHEGILLKKKNTMLHCSTSKC